MFNTGLVLSQAESKNFRFRGVPVAATQEQLAANVVANSHKLAPPRPAVTQFSARSQSVQQLVQHAASFAAKPSVNTNAVTAQPSNSAAAMQALALLPSAATVLLTLDLAQLRQAVAAHSSADGALIADAIRLSLTCESASSGAVSVDPWVASADLAAQQQLVIGHDMPAVISSAAESRTGSTASVSDLQLSDRLQPAIRPVGNAAGSIAAAMRSAQPRLHCASELDSHDVSPKDVSLHLKAKTAPDCRHDAAVTCSDGLANLGAVRERGQLLSPENSQGAVGSSEGVGSGVVALQSLRVGSMARAHEARGLSG